MLINTRKYGLTGRITFPIRWTCSLLSSSPTYITMIGREYYGLDINRNRYISFAENKIDTSNHRYYVQTVDPAPARTEVSTILPSEVGPFRIGTALEIGINIISTRILLNIASMRLIKTIRVSHRSISIKPHIGNCSTLVEEFKRYKNLFIRADDRCLAYSISLARFLHKRNVEFSMYVGVRDIPFAAHCWLQQGDLVLTDAVSSVSEFKVIAVI